MGGIEGGPVIRRIFGLLVGSAAIGAATYYNILNAGGINAPDAWIIVALSILLPVGMSYAAHEFAAGGFLVKCAALGLALCLLAGELYWFVTNAQREYALSQSAQIPLNDAIALRAKLQRRLDDAQQKRDDADRAAIEQAPLPGCRKECRLLLEGSKKTAHDEFDQARRALDALPAIHETPNIAEQFGFEVWQYDFATAALRSLAIMAGSIMVALSLHPKRRQKPETLNKPTPTPTPVVRLEEVQPKKLPAPKRVDPQRELAKFAKGALKPDAAGRVSMRDVLLAYEHYCATEMLTPLERTAFVRTFADMCEHVGITVQLDGRDAYLVGAKLVA